ncbi:uncharacterized protein LOC131853233 isoform X2 [Achroia grisella]|uniref:uncharacterized protein LOC131853233 isoform X2 n=1 Tax=Achroia grisella TaxID=688607 RepID=UPI0027D214A4|nr:uncharacterized protein LOC131853233 isoform X2 [Achroia grisella]
MSYGALRRLLTEEYDERASTILIESPFIETSRDGQRLSMVQLGLTSDKLIIASKTPKTAISHFDMIEDSKLELCHLYPIRSVQMSVFKQSIRQSLKLIINNSLIKYFELGFMKKREIFWELWCSYAMEINNKLRRWPYSETSTETDYQDLTLKIPFVLKLYRERILLSEK